jgi:wyosine [tRNA(Phe)-imidazoG37] synthetase (radical SAM superfamily)
MNYLFGPVISSRLGKSLGVDIIPAKLCNFDCLYCECGKTISKIGRRLCFVNRDKLIEEFKEFMAQDNEESHHVVTVTGSGEPTLEIQLADIILDLRELTSRPIAVLTNSSWMHDEEVREALGNADIILPSLDAARQETFLRIDQPGPEIYIEEIIQGMIQFRKDFPNVRFWLEVLFVKGINDGAKDIEALRKAVEKINPDRLDVMTVTRPPAYGDAKPVSGSKMIELQEEIVPRRLNPTFKNRMQQGAIECVEQNLRMNFERVIDVLERRPCDLKDMVLMTGLGEFDIEVQLKSLLEKNIIYRRFHEGRIFYGIVHGRNLASNNLFQT